MCWMTRIFDTNSDDIPIPTKFSKFCPGQSCCISFSGLSIIIPWIFQTHPRVSKNSDGIRLVMEFKGLYMTLYDYIFQTLRLLKAGWWLGHPSEKYDFVNWDDSKPNISGKIQKMATKPPTRKELKGSYSHQVVPIEFQHFSAMATMATVLAETQLLLRGTVRYSEAW